MTSLQKIESFLSEPRNVIIAGVRKNGRPHLSPNWFVWDGERFTTSITRSRVKYKILKRDPHAELLIDDSTAHRVVLVSVSVDIREDPATELARFRRIREKYGMAVPGDEEFLATLRETERVLLVMTPDLPPEQWTSWGLDD